MNWQQRPKFVTPCAAQKSFDTGGIEIKGKGIDVGKHRTRPGANNGTGRSEETKRSGKDLVAGLNSGGGDGQPQSISPRGAANGVPSATEVGKVALESLNLRPQNVVLRGAHPAYGGQDFGA